MAELKRHIKQDTFNPVKEDLSGANAKRAIWSSRSLDLALEGLKQGRKLVANPFYENNTSILKGDLVFERTEDEIKEYLAGNLCRCTGYSGQIRAIKKYLAWKKEQEA